MSVVLENMIGTLESTGDFRVLRRFDRPETYNEDDRGPTLLGVVVDVETTGLDAASCGLLEVAIVPFTFCRETGRIFRVLPAYSALHDPGMPIPEAVTLLTGITDDMVKGRAADPEAVQAIVKDAAIVIAHHAAFDRPVLERYFAIFATKAWACSCTQIDWRAEGFGTEKLELLAYKHRLWYVPHRADDDCRLVIDLLSRTLPRSSKRALLTLLETARRPSWRVLALDTPFEKKDTLKSRKYRWSPGDAGIPKGWWRELASKEDCNEELTWLREAVYQSDTTVPIQRITAWTRFSRRG